MIDASCHIPCPFVSAITGTSVQSAPTRIALVIGNGDYEHAPLKNSVNDAALMASTLRSVGFEVLDYSNVNRRELKRSFTKFGRQETTL